MAANTPPAAMEPGSASQDWFTPIEAIPQTLERVRAAGPILQLARRRELLLQLSKLLDDARVDLEQALWLDLRKSKTECSLMEFIPVQNEIACMLKNLERWASPRAVDVPLMLRMDGCQVLAEPLGTILIMGAWNYPVQLTLMPLAGVLAAGNTAVLKPSEQAPHTARLLARLLPQYLPPDAVAVINGGVPETTELLRHRFDKIVYTGGSAVARVVYRAAAEHLTPVLLELGGKSPAIVDSEVDVRVAARRIAWGRFVNAGQSCIAPDYVLCHESVLERLCIELRTAVQQFYGPDPQASPDYGRLVSAAHWDRVHALLAETRRLDPQVQVVCGGDADREDLYLAPTVLAHVSPESPVMREEIFGPLLPVIAVPSVDAAISFVKQRPKPLALYCFTRDKQVSWRVARQTSSGAFVSNDTLVHHTVESFPFGGVGESGTGAYHGRFSFLEFSHTKPIMLRGLGLERMQAVRYPPYSEAKRDLVEAVASKHPRAGRTWGIRKLLSGLRSLL